MAVATSTLIAGGLAAGLLFNASRQKTPKLPELPAIPEPPPPLSQDRGDITRARLRQRRKSIGGQGRRSTLLTGPQGLTDPAPVQRKTLLGS